MKIKVPCNIHNRFDVFVKNVETGAEKQVAYAENIILNRLWSFPWTSTGFNGNAGTLHLFKAIAVGDGSGAISEDRTNLFHEVFTIAVGGYTYTVNEEESYVVCRGAITRTELQDENVEYSEIGIKAQEGISGSNYVLMTHAMLRDMNGNITTIVKKNTEIITFYASLYMFIPNREFYGGSVYFTSLAHSLITSIINSSSGQFTKTIAFISGQYVTNEVLVGSAVPAYYTKDADVSWSSLTKTLKFSLRVAVGSGNGFDEYDLYGFWQLRHSNLVLQLQVPQAPTIQGVPWYPDSDITGENIGIGDGIKKYFKTKFPYPTDVTVKIDGDAISPTEYTINQTHVPSNLLDRLFFKDEKGFYNPYYATFGIEKVYMYNNNSLLASQDGDNWVTVASGDGTKTIPVQYRNYKYWKANITSGSAVSMRTFKLEGLTEEDLTNIHFNIAPDEDAVITIDYTTPVIPKDNNHVFDFTLEYVFGEYIPE